MKALRLLAALAAFALASAAFTAGPATAATTHSVVVENLQFSNGTACGAGTGSDVVVVGRLSSTTTMPVIDG